MKWPLNADIASADLLILLIYIITFFLAPGIVLAFSLTIISLNNPNIYISVILTSSTINERTWVHVTPYNTREYAKLKLI
jgi:hypothetical protein